MQRVLADCDGGVSGMELLHGRLESDLDYLASGGGAVCSGEKCLYGSDRKEAFRQIIC